MQAKLLVVLQNRTIIPVGSNENIPVDIRLICATNCNLDQLIAQQQFREDLLYRINTIRIEVPPLRERGEDIELLANHFLKVFEKKYRKNPLKINAGAISKLTKYHWPGNVRELQHTIEKAVILADTPTLRPEDFVIKPLLRNREQCLLSLDEMEKQLIEDSLEKHNGNLTAVANQLGITRQTLYNKMKRHDL
jgi:transcriptional regulator with PAS, ATPase and Fis domain